MRILFHFTTIVILFLSGDIFSQQLDQIHIDSEGVMRWRKDSSEVIGFGVNYTVPFAHAYRSGKKLGVDLKRAIDNDVYHFARLGLDLFRVHVWDCEISDTLGNLLDNEHLELFDYLLFKLQERGINSVITPIAYWGNGWPDPDEPTPGFSHKYGKDGCLINPDAIKAQENYLSQFVNHVNRFTGIAYKNDPKILAFEVCNEPHHRGTPEEVTTFVRKMKDAIRVTGCTKPVFYNVTHSIHLADAYFDAGIDGGTFQWYPTGLGFQKELGGNMLPNVDRYEIPFDDVLKKNGAARFVYEFDAADMLSTYMYPAMARSFRTAGMQLATHFSYDPTYLAPFNTEYNTHYMNLVYAPQKALSLMICSEVFRRIPLYKDFGVYPDNASFGPFRVSYEDDLAEMVTEEKFIYTNHTTTKIKSPGKLKLIAGWGNSSIVEYDGTGAYFMDKLGEGIWRLEIMPDAVIVDNVFGRNNLDTKRAVIKYEQRKIKINLPEYEYGYAIESIDWRDSFLFRETLGGYVDVKPGVYLLISPEHQEEDSILLTMPENRKLEEYYAPETNLDRTYVSYDPVFRWSQDKELRLKATFISSGEADSVVISYEQGPKSGHKRMEVIHGYEYEALLPKIYSSGRHLLYSVMGGKGKEILFQPDIDTLTEGIHANYAYLELEKSSDPISLFSPAFFPWLNWQWIRDSGPIFENRAPKVFHLKVNGLTKMDDENPDAAPVGDYTLRYFFANDIKGRKQDLIQKDSLIFKGHAVGSSNFKIQLSLVMKDGSAFGGIVEIDSIQQQYSLPIKDLKRVRPVLLPRPYPTFLPYFSEAGKATKLDLSQVESLQISIGPGINEKDWGKVYEVMIGSVWLE